MSTTNTAAQNLDFSAVNTSEEFHPNGLLAYTETVAVLTAESAHLYENRRVHPDGYAWIRIGKQAKYYDNGQLAWEAEYTEGGDWKGPAKRQYRKDGSIIVY